MAKSTLGSLMPLIITFVLLAIVSAVGYVAYSIAVDVADKTNKKMEKKNMSFSKDGMKVGVKEVTAEQVGDSAQKILMKTWTTQERPAFQLKTGLSSRSASSKSPATTPDASTERRKPFSRGSSTQAAKAQ